MSVIEIANLTRNYGDNRGVFDLSIAVEKGEVFGFLGPNGAGKTTTIRHLMGFLKSQKGSCKIGGLDCWDGRTEIQKNLGYIPGEIAFFDDMTGIEFLNFSASYRKLKDTSRMNELIERFELNPKGKMKKMSKGNKQKVGIISALMHNPEFIILDEPTSGLDPLMQNRFIELIIEEKNRGKTIFMSSHIFEEVERTCHRVSIIKDGRLVASDSVDSLKQAQIRKYIITLNDENEAKKFQAEFAETSISQNNVTVFIRNDIKKMIEVMNRHDVINISAPSQSLEEIFMHYYGGERDD